MRTAARFFRLPAAAAAIFLLSLFAGSDALASENGCFIREDASAVYIGNEFLTLAFDRFKGLLLSAKSAAPRGPDIFSSDPACSDRALFSLFLDEAAPTIWSARLARRVDARSLKLSAVEPKSSAEKAGLVFRYKNAGAPGISVAVSVDVENGSKTAEFRLEIENRSSAVVTAAVFPQIAGLKTHPAAALAWPEGHGKIFRNIPPEFLRILPYPAPASMQWFFYKTNDASLFLAVLDNSASYKELRFGYDRALDSSTGGSFTLYPFVAPQKSWRSPKALLGIGMESWHEGASIYRKWLIEDAKWTKDVSAWVRTLHAVSPLVIRNASEKRLSMFSDIPVRLSALMKAGVSAIQVAGWNRAGLDGQYPDYTVAEDAGGEKGLADALTAAHSLGGHVFFHMNGRLAAEKGRFYSLYGLDARAYGSDLAPFVETWGRIKFQVMCPFARSWLDQMEFYVEKLRDFGADGIWLDGIGEEPARLCYNVVHGHKTPAGAFGEGTLLMLDEFSKILRGEAAGPTEKSDRRGLNAPQERRKSPDAAIFYEGIVDALGEIADVHGQVWARPFGFVYEDAPELARYTIPGKMLGLKSAGSEEGTICEFGRAFIMGLPLAGGNEKTKRIFDIYDRAGDCFHTGSFRDNLGIKIKSNFVRAGVLASPDGKHAALTFLNESADPFDGSVFFTPAKAMLSGAVSKALDLETGGAPGDGKPLEMIAVPFKTAAGGEIEIPLKIPARDIRAILLVLE
jgi:hypothetical protein